jgi:hypothetical protein
MQHLDPSNVILALRSTGMCLVLLALPWAVLAQDAPRPAAGIYTCTDSKGNKLRSDRPIRECADREQDLLNPDGSRKGVYPPSQTYEERAEREARERKLLEDRAAVVDAGRRDRNLVKRYPNEAAHQRAREVALDTMQHAIRASEQRLRALAAERKPLLNEAEFYQGRPPPPKLKNLLDANDAATEAQRQSAATQEAELARVTRQFDAELERLRKLWAGAVPGSLGPLVVPPAPSAAAPGSRKPAPG